MKPGFTLIQFLSHSANINCAPNYSTDAGWGKGGKEEEQQERGSPAAGAPGLTDM